MQQADLIIDNIGELVTLAGDDNPRTGDMRNLGIVCNSAVAVYEGKICAAGERQEIVEHWEGEIIDAKGALVTPGFVDPHTHPVFAATREEEFEMRVQGKSYQEIAKAGGGIRNSVRRLREMPKGLLKELVRKRLDGFLRLGTTTIEAKSGYGLSTKDEIKSLEILAELSKEHPIDIVPTFLGAHEIPDEYQDDREGYIRLLIEEMIPQVAERKLARYCDIFCEDQVFNVEESRRILQAAKDAGLELKLHAEEFVSLGGAKLAASLGAVSADHLVAISGEGIEAMREARVTAVLLPATTFYLGKGRYAPARSMIESGLPVALSTDFNPGSSMTQSMQMVLSLACVYLHMIPAESWTAATINSACAIGMGEAVGSIIPGKQADMVIWDAKSYRYIPYHFGDNLASVVIKKGKVVFRR